MVLDAVQSGSLLIRSGGGQVWGLVVILKQKTGSKLRIGNNVAFCGDPLASGIIKTPLVSTASLK